jgi:hypothetical protein
MAKFKLFLSVLIYAILSIVIFMGVFHIVLYFSGLTSEDVSNDIIAVLTIVVITACILFSLFSGIIKNLKKNIKKNYNWDWL